MEKDRVSDWKIADLWFDFQTGNAWLCPRKDTLRLFLIEVKQSTRSGGSA